MTLYTISENLKAVSELMAAAVDEEGEPRELTEQEQFQLAEWFSQDAEALDDKLTNYGKFFKNLKISAETIDGERKAHKAELDRLARRAKAMENRADALKYAVKFAFDNMGIDKHKTELFSFYKQKTPLKITEFLGNGLKDVPEEYLKPRELVIALFSPAAEKSVRHDVLDIIKDYNVRCRRPQGGYNFRGLVTVKDFITFAPERQGFPRHVDQAHALKAVAQARRLAGPCLPGYHRQNCHGYLLSFCSTHRSSKTVSSLLKLVAGATL